MKTTKLWKCKDLLVMESENKELTVLELQKELSKRYLMFCEYYVGEAKFNGTKAAILAGYSEKSARSKASQLLTIVNISKYIELRLKELTLSANEVLVKLTEIANCDFDEFNDEDGNFDIDIARSTNKTHLIKKYKKKKRTLETKIDEDNIENNILYEEIEIEMHSSHEALRDIGRHHKLFTDKQEIKTDQNITHTLDPEIAKALKAGYDSVTDEK